MIAQPPVGPAAALLTGILVFAAALSGCSQVRQKAAVPFDLYTHCGINQLSVGGQYFQHVGGSLTDGSGNPPAGWGNPYQHGTLSVSGDVAVFRDKIGHVERFKVHARPSQFLATCS